MGGSTRRFDGNFEPTKACHGHEQRFGWTRPSAGHSIQLGVKSPQNYLRFGWQLGNKVARSSNYAIRSVQGTTMSSIAASLVVMANKGKKTIQHHY
eukprot:m.225686 g.225686  ORF g.225686 m.225686 type:complete len:96 (+) comp17043_c0_seq7:4518-4805(+)